MTTPQLKHDLGFAFALAVLVVMIFGNRFGHRHPNPRGHEAHIELQKTQSWIKWAKIEEQRLMIEQQTFSATPQVAQRAASEPGMFFRPMKTAVSLRWALSLTGAKPR